MGPEDADAVSEHPNNVDSELDEEQILESLSRLRLEIFRIETTTGPSRRTICIQNEIDRLEAQLAYCKTQAKAHTNEESQDQL